MDNIKKHIKSNHKKIIFGIVLLVSFILIMILNLRTGYSSDDFKYHFFFDTIGNPTADARQIGSLGDIIVSMYNHWHMWNGRMTVHALLMIILQGGELFFDIFNSLMYVLLGILIYKHSAPEKINIPLIIGIYLMMWFFLPQFGATCLWASGSANYLWSSILILTYMLPYRKYAFNQDNRKDNVKNTVIMSVTGLFVGCTNENTGGALALACILFIVYYKLNGIKIPKWSWCGVISTILGAVILILSPGNYRVNSKTDFAGLVARFEDIYNISAKLMFLLLVIYAVILVMLAYKSEKKKPLLSLEVFSLIYIVPALASIFVLIFSAQHPERTWFLAIVLFICATGYLYTKLELHKYRKYIPIAIFTIIFAFSFTTELKDVNNTYKQVREGILLIEEAKENGETSVSIPKVIPSKSKYDPYNITSYVNKNADDWMNTWMAEYYEIEKITGIEKDKK